jgi:cysteinyl-tRNA synthetase
VIQLHNTFIRSTETFVPLTAGRAGIYSCGPTVYRDVHIGNLRTYLMADWLRRVLEAKGLEVKQVKNITDVGHMRQDLLERGEDKVLAAALAAGKTPLELAEEYTQSFLRDEAALNIQPEHVFPRATAHVPHMIDLIGRLIERGMAYVVDGNVYYSVERFPTYGRLSGNTGESLLEGVRVETDPLKRDPRDFALWKAAEAGRSMRWQSPWGEGFPGWHIECSAMSLKHLGERFDIHTGGVDNVFPHHEDERAQSEGALGHDVVRYWVHGQHLLVDGVKMAKSTGNVYTLSDLQARGYDPLALRYLCATVHYRHRLNFTFDSLRAASVGLDRLRQEAALVSAAASRDGEGSEAARWQEAFEHELDNDLHLPGALAVVWELVHSDEAPVTKTELLRSFDRVLGLDLLPTAAAVPHAVRLLVTQRQELRDRAAFEEADVLRERIAAAGYHVLDTQGGPALAPVTSEPERIEAVHSSRDVRSRLAEPDAVQFSVVIVGRDDLAGVRRCAEAVLRHADDAELIVVDNASTDGTAEWLREVSARDARVRPIVCDHNLGTGAARNCGMLGARGRHVVLVDTSVEFAGDVLGPLASALKSETAGIVGAFGVNTRDLRDFEDAPPPDVDAVEGYLMAFRRDRVLEVGLMDEKFRFYRHLDLDYSFAFRAKGYRNRIVPGLPIARHAHADWERTPPEERERLSKRNFYRFLKKHGHRTDLLLANASKA